MERSRCSISPEPEFFLIRLLAIYAMQFVRGEFVSWTHVLALATRCWPLCRDFSLCSSSRICARCNGGDDLATLEIKAMGRVTVICLACLYDGAFPHGERKVPRRAADLKVSAKDSVEAYAAAVGVRVSVPMELTDSDDDSDATVDYDNDVDRIADELNECFSSCPRSFWHGSAARAPTLSH